jgi:branched-chain amino acid transport system ATP-binding protein
MLIIKSIEAYYGSIRALQDVSLEVQKGEIVALIGSNGAGKTSTLKAIVGLLRPARGGVEFLGEKISGLSAHVIVRRGISMVPEGRKIFPELTVQENLEMGGYILKDPKQYSVLLGEIQSLFPRLRERKTQKGGSLSGGEQQMLAMARALMSAPQLLLLDEPSMGLAPLIVKHIFLLIRNLQGRAMTILLVEQNAKAALGIADRGYVIENGLITLKDSGRMLLANEKVREAYLGI